MSPRREHTVIPRLAILALALPTLVVVGLVARSPMSGGGPLAVAKTGEPARPAGPPRPQESPMSHAAGPENRLAQESSPYLLLHKNNPVDWYPWGPEALERARREGKPIFLSVGYSTCYWCHVMERESFSDPAVAELMNRWFVNIKVDREERPDLDEIYMTATQVLSGHGGWPNSVFLTPELKPFYAGTYFPPEDRQGRPGFPSLLRGLAEAWEGRRVEVEQQAEELAGVMRRYIEERVQPGERPPQPAAIDRARQALAARFDARDGGFGGAPKFPTPSNLFFLLELAGDDGEAAEMLDVTLDRMARGGICDQLAGGFHRYATDREWKVPHFEKMLYDNALLLELYARRYAATGDPQAARVARETAAWVGREMTSPEGAFWSAVDAETDGREGAYYVWTRQELLAALGEEDFAFLAPLYGFDGSPFFEGEHYVLHLPAPLAGQAKRRRMDADRLLVEMAGPRGTLLAARDRRPRPATDDKVLADWNGMMIAGLATAGRLLDDRGMVDRAAAAAGFVLRELRPGGDGGRELRHTWRGGEARVPAFLDDYAYLLRGLLALDLATGDPAWRRAAAELAGEMVARLRAPAGGFYVAAASDDLLFRSQDPFDGAVPAANAVAVLALIDLAERSGEERWLDEARAALAAFAPLVEQFPDGARMMTLAAHRWHQRSGAAADASGDGGRAAAAAGGPAVAAGSAALAAETADAVRAAVRAGAPDAAGWRRFRLTLEVAEGWHLNANPASGERLIATAVAAAAGEVRRLEYPPGEPYRPAFADGDELAVYRGEVEIGGEARAAGDEAVRLEVTFQPCDETRCLPPTTVELPLG